MIHAISFLPKSVRRSFDALAIVIMLGLLPACGLFLGDVEIERRAPPDASVGQGPLTPSANTACGPGQVRCQGRVLQGCLQDGSGWAPLQRCASAALCVDAPGEVSRCLEPACELGVTCAGSELRQCNADLTGFERLAICASAAHCDGMRGACEEAPCEPGEISCNGSSLQRCSESLAGYELLASCATAALCGDLLASACPEGGERCEPGPVECPRPACEPGELRCSGTRLELCNVARNGWDFVDECVTAGVCELTRSNPGAVVCAEPACDPGDVVCSSTGARLECNAERTEHSSQISQCRSAQDCTPAGCQVDPCVPGELSCNGPSLLQCQEGPDGRAARVVLDTCATRQLCELGLTRPGAPACAPPACAPGEFSCAGRQMQICNAGRTNFVNHQLCATDGLCDAGAGLGACPAPCSGAACNGSMLRKCNAELTALVDVEDCGTAAECDSAAGACSDPCVPGAVRCNGAALERCDSPLDGWRRLETCVSSGLCQESVRTGAASCSPPRCSAGEHRCVGQRLEACNAERTGFETVRTCLAGELCDAANRQCDVCAPGSVSCSGDVLSRCAANGQSESAQVCGAGLCSASGPNVGCLQCQAAGGFRCDNQGSLFECSADQRQETQVEVCRAPQLCRAAEGRCLDCDPVGSSRCEGAEVLECLPGNTESPSRTCASPELCLASAGSATCADSPCTTQLQCTNQGEVLVCNPGQTGYVSQKPAVFCDSPALCDADAEGGCRAPACAPGERRCDGAAVEICNQARTGFRLEQTCGDGFACTETGSDAACRCTPGSHRCAAGQGLVRCDAGGTAFTPVAAGAACEGAERVSCNGPSLFRQACPDEASCLAGTGPQCAECVAAADCDDGSFCSGVEACSDGSCQPGAAPCAAGLLCVESVERCVECLEDADCPAGQVCSDDACVADPIDGGT